MKSWHLDVFCLFFLFLYKVFLPPFSGPILFGEKLEIHQSSTSVKIQKKGECEWLKLSFIIQHSLQKKSLSSKVIPVQGMLSNPVKSSSICRCFHPPWLSPAALPWKIQIKIRKILHLLLICLRPLFSSYFLIEIERRWWTGWTQRCLRQFDNFYFVLQGSF